VTMVIEESSDNGGGDAFAAVVGGTFTQVTAAPDSERIVTGTIAVEQYLRVSTTTSGGFTSVQFVVSISRTP
jgi:hypothetical protein